MKTYILDGYNVIFSIPHIEAETNVSLELARDTLFHFCDKFLEARKDTKKIHIVFDGKSQYAELANDSYGKIEVIYTATGQTADDAIIKILDEMSSLRQTYVVSNDNYVRNHARVFGVDRLHVHEFEALAQKNAESRSGCSDKKLPADEAQKVTDEYRRYLNL